MNVDKWIVALQHPLVLGGFALFLFASLIKPLFLNNKKLSGTATERLLVRGMNLAFALALLAIAGGLLLSWKPNATDGEINLILILAVLAAGVSLLLNYLNVQSTKGSNSPVINAEGNVALTYGLDEKQLEVMLKEHEERIVSKILNQQNLLKDRAGQSTQGDQSPTIKTGGNVHTNCGDTITIGAQGHFIGLSLKQQLQIVQNKLADLKKTYDEELTRRKSIAEALIILIKLQRQMPEEQIRQAKAKLERGDTEAAKQVFRELAEKKSDAAALAAYQLGQIAESELDYTEAIQQYKKAVALEKDNVEYRQAVERYQQAAERSPYELQGNA
jgi:tetratricopeptide (TPR) repeat protein